MEWFKHYSNAHDDPVVSDAWDRFGDFGYLFWFVLIELYAANFNPKFPDRGLTISFKQLRRKLRKSYTKVELLLNFFSKRQKLTFKKDQDYITIVIPKFSMIVSNWTKRRLSEKHHAPTEAPTEAPHARRLDKTRTPPIVPPMGGVPHKKIISLYHEILPSLPKIRKWDETAKRNLRARWNEDKQQQSISFWENYFKRVSMSSFLLGDNDKGWTADLRWLVRPSNFAKVINGNYMKKTVGPKVTFVPSKDFSIHDRGVD